MRTKLRNFARDQRGASMPEYALMLFAVLIGAAAAMKHVGPRVYLAADVTRRLLAGEDVTVDGSNGSALGSMSAPASGSSTGGDTSGSNGTASSGSNGVASNGFVGSSSAGSSGGSGGGGVLNGGGVVLGATGSQSISGSASSVGSDFGQQTTDAINAQPASGSNAIASNASNAFASNAASAGESPRGFLGGTGAPPSAGSSRASASSGTSASTQNSVNPAPPSTSGDPGITGNGYAISAQGEKEMQTLLAQAKQNADGKRPLGYCYRQVKTDIAEVGYGNIAKQGNTSQLKPLPAADQGSAHDFADYMNATAANGHTNADNLGLQKLPITNPYDAPPGSIVVVRAGTPGTRNPVAGDIVVAGGGGKFYNDGNMGYGGSKNFPAGNNYVLGIYAPK